MKMIIITSLLLNFVNFSYAEETSSEKAKASMNTAGRKTKKVINRGKEALCGTLTGDNKVECLAKKSKHKIEEGVDSVKDKGSEVKNKLDTK